MRGRVNLQGKELLMQYQLKGSHNFLLINKSIDQSIDQSINQSIRIGTCGLVSMRVITRMIESDHSQALT